MADVCNGTLFQAWSIPHLAEGVADGIEIDHADAKWSVDGPALLEKLRDFSPLKTYALVDAIERFWAASTRGSNTPYAEILTRPIAAPDALPGIEETPSTSPS
jgi:hypothetical protein